MIDPNGHPLQSSPQMNEGVTMGKVTGFLEIDRQELKYQPAADRIRHFKEFTLPLSEPEVGAYSSSEPASITGESAGGWCSSETGETG